MPSWLVPVLAALLGTLVGGVIAEVRVALDGRRGRQRSINAVLRYQLEVLYVLQRIDKESFVAAVAAVIEARVPGGGPEVALALQNDPRVLDGMVQATSDTLNSELLDQFAGAIEKLAESEPVLAYRLSTLDRLSPIQGKLEGLTEVLPADAWGSTNPADLKNAFAPELYRLAAQAVEKDISLTTPYLMRRHRRELLDAIALLKERAFLQQKSEIEDYWLMMDKVIASLSAQVKT
jgi:hypothetical protein